MTGDTEAEMVLQLKSSHPLYVCQVTFGFVAEELPILWKHLVVATTEETSAPMTLFGIF